MASVLIFMVPESALFNVELVPILTKPLELIISELLRSVVAPSIILLDPVRMLIVCALVSVPPPARLFVFQSTLPLPLKLKLADVGTNKSLSQLSEPFKLPLNDPVIVNGSVHFNEALAPTLYVPFDKAVFALNSHNVPLSI